MPARAEEIQHAEEEGIEFITLVAPTRFIGDDEGWLQGVEVIRMELGEPDESGRRRPVPVEGSEVVIDAETAVIAVGNEANSSALSGTTGIQTNRWGLIVCDPETGATSRPGVFAGGDIVTGGATVILAMGAGRRAAKAIHEYLTKQTSSVSA
jgi:glutamate synthase (NADPH/NADH) small chain